MIYSYFINFLSQYVLSLMPHSCLRLTGTVRFKTLHTEQYIHWCSSCISHQLDLYEICLAQLK